MNKTGEKTWLGLKWVQNKKVVCLGVTVFLLLSVVIFTLASSVLNRGIRLVGIDPSGEIDIKTNITFSFSGDVVDAKDVGITSGELLVKFDPPVPGKFRWVSQRELRFLPEVPFRPSTKYIAEVRGDIVKARDKFFTGKRRLEFSTCRFKVENVSLSFAYPLEQKRGQMLQAHLNFNYPVSPKELQKALDLRFKDGKEIKYNLNSTENSNNFIVSSELLLLNNADRRIELTVSKGLRCVGGKLGLDQDVTTEAVLGAKKDLTVIEAAPKTDSAKCWIAVHCSETVDPKLMTGFVRLKPEVPFQLEADGDYIYIKSDRFKPGESYNVRLNAGLPSLNGYPLKRDFSVNVSFTDLEPSLKFNTPGRYLSSKGNLNLGLETVNVERVNLEISRIYANNIVNYLNSMDGEDYLYSYQIERMGKVVKSEVIKLNAPKNEMVLTPINLKEYLSNFRGILQVVVYDDEERWRQDSKYVIITDLGIVSKLAADELTVWVNSLESLQPKAKAKVTLFSKNNQTLAEEYTDNRGIARFKGIKKAVSGFEPFLILAELENDFSFVHFATSQISTTDFDVRGRRHLVDGYEAYLYMDRDVFRPGDKGNLVGLIRGENASMPPEFPVKLEIRQPDGQIFKELQSNTGNRGACEFGIEIPEYAQTGKYQAKLLVAKENIGTTAFSVEEFMPERIKVSTKLDKEKYSGGEQAKIQIEGMNLFGPPAVGRRVTLKLTLEPAAFNPRGYASFAFGDPDQSFKVKEEELGESKLDAGGVASYTYKFPEGLTPPAKLRAIFQGTVIEDGGRAVSNFKIADFHAYERYIGIRSLSDYYCDLNKPYELKWIVLDREGRPAPATEVSAEVFHITWNSIYRKNDSGRYEYVSEEERSLVAKKRLTLGKGEQLFSYTPREYGEYQIVLRDVNGGSRAAVKFYASGWGYSPWAMDMPDKIQLETGKKLYRVGEQAEIQVKAPFSGKALVTVEREKVYDIRVVDFKQNTGLLKIPVKPEYKPNAYVSVHLIRSIKSLEKRAPVRAFGTVPLSVDCSDHRMDVTLDTPAELRPNREVEVSVKVGHATDNTYITLAAVDEGICQLTDYKTPNPSNFFYGKRSLNVMSYDLYGMILPEVENAKVRSAVAGDADTEGVRKQNLNPVSVKRVKPVALWSGLVKVNGNGLTRVKLKIPQFNGTLRLMAVAASGDNFGSAQKKVIIRDKIVITPTFPRFVAGKDRFDVPVSIFNGTGKAGEFKVELKTEGPVNLQNASLQTLRLDHGEEKQLIYELQAKNTVGKLAFKLLARGNQASCEVEEELPLRPSVPLTSKLISGSITAKRPWSWNSETSWLPGTATYELTVAPFPSLRFAGSLHYLLGYPYGCAEQTTSKLFPLLYFDSLAQATHSETFKGGNANYYINQGIEKLESMQLRDGSFAYWPGASYSNDWSSVYVAHFLTEARKAGFTVTDRITNRMIHYLETLTRTGDNSTDRLQIKVYALYVLSLAGKPQLSTMAYLKNLYLNNLWSYSRAQLAAAYFYSGDRAIARKLLPGSFTSGTGKRDTGANFNSTTRSDAIILSAMADIDHSNKAIYKLVDRLAKTAEPGYWGTTQENAFALMALGKVYAKKSEGKYRGEVWAGGERIASFDNQKPIKLKDRRLGKGRVEVKINGTGECYYFLKSSGISTTADLPEYNNGITVSREILDRHGNRMNPSQLRQGDLLVIHVTITVHQDDLNNIALVDMLPGGLEIENPRLVGSAKLSWLSNNTVEPDYLDIRDDRLIAFMSFANTGTYHFYYAVRAVTCGDFILPSIKADCMYDPEIGSFNSSGTVSIRR